MPFNIYLLIGKFGFLNFFLEMFCAQTLFLFKQKKRKFYVLRMLACVLFALPFCFLPPLRAGNFQFAFLVVVVYVLVCALFCYRCSPMNALFGTVAAFASQHFVWEILLILFHLLKVTGWAAGIAIYAVGYVVIYAAIFFVFPFRSVIDVGKNQRISALIASALIIVITFILSSLVGSDGEQWNILYGFYALVCCIFAFCMEFGVLKSGGLEKKNAQLNQDKATLKQLLYQEKKQQEYSKDTIEYINMKCHDLKHQISLLRSLKGNEREQSISEIEEAIMIYDNFAKTGNEALDIVLTEKGLLCEKYGIRFTYIADGEKLNFMDPVDISSLFGNALSNAIESVIKEQDKAKRIIKLNLCARHRLLTMNLENFCGFVVKFDNGLPLTDKENKRYHGFGVKSIRFIVEKYGGNLIMNQTDQLFTLSIVLPIPSSVVADGGGMA